MRYINLRENIIRCILNITNIQTKEEIQSATVLRDIQEIQKALRNTPETRAKRVQQLKTKIESGQYKVDARAIANKMISNLIRNVW